MPGTDPTTFQEHVLDEQALDQPVRMELVHLLWDFLVAVKSIHNQVTRAGLVDILGKTGATNVHGDEVKKLDAYAHDVMVAALKKSSWVYAMASEEAEQVIAGSDGENAKYVAVFDPLDGSSNIDANVSVGTIFSIYKRKDGDINEQVLRSGSEQLLSGYVIYGSSTMLVYTVGAGTHGFTFDPAMGEFYLSHPNMKTPEDGTVYSINEANEPYFDGAMKHYLSELKASRRYTGRYIGSLVADVHRNLLYGGIFVYPAAPKAKLRLLYEGMPMGWVVEQAGGLASDGSEPILQKVPKDLHERTPLVLGSKNDVERYEALVKEANNQ